ncbi:hypothetical protein PENSPDRAFT_690245 [Peniophora sp. CONT]|nr:hypothetical protein PENSPDRAFT_690245 [Peniophora sp. CONT]
MEAALSTPELIDMVFAYMPREGNTATALVCKQWLEISRDHIWFEVDVPKELFALLAPIEMLEDTGEPEFVRTPDETDWERFKPYAIRVRRLLCNRAKNISHPMTEAFLRSRSRPNPILPNLRVFGWDMASSDPSQAYLASFHLLFLHPGIRTLGLYNMPREWITWPVYDLRQFALDIAHLSPGITTLDVRPRNAGFESATLELVTRLTALQYVGMAQTLLTTNMVQALSRLPHIKKVCTVLDAMEVWDYGPDHDLDDPGHYTYPSLDDGAFRSLRVIHLCLSLEDATSLLANRCFPSFQLCDLRLRAAACANNAAVRAFMSAFAAHCIRATSLVLILYPPEYVTRDDADQVLEALDYITIKPLRQATHLQRLVIHHSIPVSISEDNLLELIEPLKELHTFVLVPRPDWREGPYGAPGPSEFGWQTLNTIIQNLPHLKETGLYCDLTLASHDLRPPSCRLQSFSLGTTPLPASTTLHALAFRLCGYLADSGFINLGFETRSLWGVPDPVYGEGEIDDETRRWKELEKLVYLGLSTRSGVDRSDESIDHDTIV